MVHFLHAFFVELTFLVMTGTDIPVEREYEMEYRPNMLSESEEIDGYDHHKSTKRRKMKEDNGKSSRGYWPPKWQHLMRLSLTINLLRFKCQT